ncbi:acyl-CoA dehydrogenase family protein [Propioniciclava sp.]|uniref:acyl-CoA dehydrogenase family protein n=1 Tax=Propioniciclava sp. TaxID=2038686 RepID=UPI002634CBAD|nr:acyl-CoA dehydrogenase family protein [Propioniciclava sp.]
MSYDESDDLFQVVADFCRHRMTSVADRLELTDGGAEVHSPTLAAEMAENGWLGIGIAPEYGGAGGTLLRWLGDAAYQAGVLLAADFVRTERNRVMEVAYRLAGFESPDELHPDDRTRFVLEPTPTADDGIIHIEAVAPFGRPTPTLWRWSGSQDETVGAEHEVAAR